MVYAKTAYQRGGAGFPVISRLRVLLPGSVQHKFPVRRTGG